MLFARLALATALASGPAAAAEFFAAPDGRPDDAGSRAEPWDLETALGQPAAVRPGDTIWLAGGHYPLARTAVAELVGAPDAPVKLRVPFGRRARLDCAPASRSSRPAPSCLEIRGAHAWYWGLEIFNSSRARVVDIPGAAGDPRGTGVHARSGPGVRLIHLAIHDVGAALFESRPSGLEIYGLVAYNSGWEGPDRSHGPGVYIRNRSDWPEKSIEDSIVFQHFRQGLQGFGSSENVFSHFRVRGNVFFNNGIGRDGFHRNLMFGNASPDHVDNVFESNVTYFSSGSGAGENRFGGNGGCSGLRLDRNVFAHGPGRVALTLANCRHVELHGNVFYGALRGRLPPEASRQVIDRPRGVLALLRPDRYEPRLARLVVFNWENRDAVWIDASQWATNGSVAVVSAQDPFAPPRRARLQRGLLEIPMRGWNVAPPIGLEQTPMPPTLPEFGVFLLTRGSGKPLRAR